jgi:hypothetical protein
MGEFRKWWGYIAVHYKTLTLQNGTGTFYKKIRDTKKYVLQNGTYYKIVLFTQRYVLRNGSVTKQYVLQSVLVTKPTCYKAVLVTKWSVTK